MASSSSFANDNNSGEDNSTMLRAATTTSSSSGTGTGTGYVEEHFPPEIIERLESGAFRALRTHLQERSDQVPNLELMTVSGFCRNCLAKVRAAYELVVRRVRQDRGLCVSSVVCKFFGIPKKQPQSCVFLSRFTVQGGSISVPSCTIVSRLSQPLLLFFNSSFGP